MVLLGYTGPDGAGWTTRAFADEESARAFVAELSPGHRAWLSEPDPTAKAGLSVKRVWRDGEPR